MELEKETAVFLSHLDEWRKDHLGAFVLIKGEEVIGFFPTLSQAFTEGLHRYALGSFFVKQISPRDNVNVSLLGKCLRATVPQ